MNKNEALKILIDLQLSEPIMDRLNEILSPFEPSQELDPKTLKKIIQLIKLQNEADQIEADMGKQTANNLLDFVSEITDALDQAVDGLK